MSARTFDPVRPDHPTPSAEHPPLVSQPLLLLAAGGYAAAGGVHLAVAPEHLATAGPEGAFFLAVGLLQVAWGLLTALRPGRLVHALGMAGALMLVGLWAWSRSAGLPLGLQPGVPASGEAADLVAVVAELVTVAATALLLLRRATPTLQRSRLATPLVAVVAGLPLVAGLLVVAGPLEHDHVASDHAFVEPRADVGPDDRDPLRRADSHLD